jgi:two-component system NtrC family sensor kinase
MDCKVVLSDKDNKLNNVICDWSSNQGFDTVRASAKNVTTIKNNIMLAIVDTDDDSELFSNLCEHLDCPILAICNSEKKEKEFHGDSGNIFYLEKPIENGQLNELIRFTATIASNRYLSKNLNERVKEINTIYEISEILDKKYDSISDYIKEITDFLPRGFQFIDNTHCQIKLNDKTYQTKNFHQTNKKISHDIKIDNNLVGKIDIFLDENDNYDFLDEERDLIKEVARKISKKIERINNLRSIKVKEHRYRSIFNNSSIAMLELDCKEVKVSLEKLRELSGDNFESNFQYTDTLINKISGMIRLVDANDYAVDLLDYIDKKSLLTNYSIVKELIPKEKLAESFKAILSQKKFYECEINFSSKLGNQKILIVRMNIPRKVKGFSHVIMSLLDITERKKFELEIKENHLMQRQILDAYPESLLVIDPDGKVLACNKTAAARFNESPKSLIGRNTNNLVPKKVAENRKKLIEQVVETTKPVTFRDKREEYDFDNYLNPIISSEGLVSKIVVVSVDITNKIIAEKKESEYVRNLEFLSETAIELVHFENDNDFMRFIATRLMLLLSDVVIIGLSRKSEDDTYEILAIDYDTGLVEVDSKLIDNLRKCKPTKISPELFMRSDNKSIFELDKGIKDLETYSFSKEFRLILGKIGVVKGIFLTAFAHGTSFDKAILMVDFAESGIRENQTLETLLKVASIAYQRYFSNQEISKFVDIVNNMRVGLFIFEYKLVGDEYNFILESTNPLAKTILGKEHQFYKGFGIEDVFVSANIEYLKKNMLEVADSYQSMLFDDIEIIDNGHSKWFSVRAFPLPNSTIGLTLDDITDRKNAEQSLEFRANFEKIITEISANFVLIGNDKLLHGIDFALKNLGKFIRAERCYIFLIAGDDRHMSLTNEWCDDGLKKIKNLYQDVPCNYQSWWLRKLAMKETVRVEDIDVVTDLSPKSDLGQYYSSVLIPLISKNRMIGFIGFDNYQNHQNWGTREEPLMKLTGEVISNAIDKYHDEIEKSKSDMKMKKLTMAVEQSANSIIITDINGYIEYVNPKFIEQTGYGYGEVLGQNPRILKSGHTRTSEYSGMWETILSGEEWSGEFKNIKKNGEEYWEQTLISPIKNSHGEITNFIAIKEDITEKKNFDEEVNKTNRTLKIISECNIALLLAGNEKELLTEFCNILVYHAGYSFAWISKQIGENPNDGLNVYASAGIDKNLGNELGCEKIQQKCHTCQNYKAHNETAIQTGPLPKDFSLCNSDYGNDKYRNLTSIPLRGSNSLYGVLNVLSTEFDEIEMEEIQLISDVTNYLVYGIDTLRSKIEKQMAEHALASEKEELSVTLGSIIEGVISTNLDGKILVVNKSAEDIFEIKDEDLEGMDISVLSNYLVPELSSDLQIVTDVIKDYKRNRLVNEKFIINTKSDKNKILRISTSEIKDVNESARGIVFIFNDVTDRIKIENQLSLSQKMESIGQLAAGIAHEMNTPLQFVGDNSYFLKDAFDDLLLYIRSINNIVGKVDENTNFDKMKQQIADYQEEYDLDFLFGEIPIAIDRSQNGIERVSNIVMAMKNFAHPTGKKKSLSNINEGINVTTVISKNEWKYVCDLETDLEDELPLVYCSLDEINQVILNMIVNGAHAVEDKLGKGSLEKGLIRIKTLSKGENVEIHISDTGSGIPPEKVSRIFDPFFTTKEVGKGTGQGLAISHDIIVKKHKGKIFVESEMGEGTKFIISLPIKDQSS